MRQRILANQCDQEKGTGSSDEGAAACPTFPRDMPESADAPSVLPVPGGPIIKTLWALSRTEVITYTSSSTTVQLSKEIAERQ